MKLDSIEDCPINHYQEKREYYKSIERATENNFGLPPDLGMYTCDICLYQSW